MTIPHPYFSVVIPLFNKERYIRRALDSVLEQSFSDIEVLIINDGSTDKSSDAIRAYSDPRVNLVNQENRGAALARNRGIDIATSPFTCFLDADDYWKPSFLSEIQLAICAFPEADVFSTAYEIVTEDNQEVPANLVTNISAGSVGILDSFFKSFSVGATPINSINSCFRSSVLRELGGFPPNVKQHEDMSLWVKLSLSGHTIIFINKNLAVNRRDSQSKIERAKRGLFEKNLPYEEQILKAVQNVFDPDRRYYLACLNKLYFMRAVNALHCREMSIVRFWASKINGVSNKDRFFKYFLFIMSYLPPYLIRVSFWFSRILKRVRRKLCSGSASKSEGI